MLPADNLCKQLDLDHALQNVKPNLDPNCLALNWFSDEVN